MFDSQYFKDACKDLSNELRVDKALTFTRLMANAARSKRLVEYSEAMDTCLIDRGRIGTYAALLGTVCNIINLPFLSTLLVQKNTAMPNPDCGKFLDLEDEDEVELEMIRCFKAFAGFTQPQFKKITTKLHVKTRCLLTSTLFTL